MKKLHLKIILLSMVLMAVMLSCGKKDKDPNPDDEKESIEDNNTAQKEYDDVLNIVEEGMSKHNDDMDKSSSSSQFSLADTTCATITIDTAYSVGGVKGRITVDFGTTNCTGVDGRMRRGKIYVDYTGKYRTVGTVITTTFDNYYIDDNKIEGIKVVTHESEYIYKVQVTGAKITYTDNTSISWESERTRKWTEGHDNLADMLNIWNDVYEITGTASGTGRLGRKFTVKISDTDPLVVKLECWLVKIWHPVSGTVTISPENLKDRVLDYGDGACDKTATLTVGDNEPVTYTLK